MPKISPTQLRTALSDLFSTGELRTLCFDLGIEYEDLEGAGKSTKALALVQYAQRHGRYEELVYRVQQLRPRANLGTAVPAPPNIVAQQGPQQVTNVYVGGDYVGGDKVGGDKVGGDKVSGGKTEAGRDVIMTGGGDYAGRDMTKQSAGGDLYSAGGDININANPQDKAEFFQTLNAVKKLLEEAIANGEFEDERDGEDALKEMQDISEEANSEEPRPRSIRRSLGNLADILGGATKAAEAAGKAGTAVLKATPIIAGLIKAIGIIF